MSAADDFAVEAALARRLRLYEVLETARRSICCYSGDPCDCKYGVNPNTNASSEATGCPELRDLTETLTGFAAYHRGQSIEDDVAAFRARSVSLPEPPETKA